MAKRKGKTHANLVGVAAVSVPAPGVPAEANQTAVAGGQSADSSGPVDGEAASGAVEGAAAGPGTGAIAPADQAEASTERGGADAGMASAQADNAGGASPSGAGLAMGQDQAPAAVGGVADAAEVFPVQPIGEGAGFVGLDGEGRAHLSEGPQAAGSIAALFGKVLPNATPVTIEGPEIDPAGDTVTLTPAQLVAFARSLGVRDVCVAAFSGMIHALAPIMGALGKGDETTLGGFATDFMPMVWADEAHALIVAHPGLAPDALWLHLTARELFPRGAERFADLPLHEQYGFRLLIALHEAAWRVVSAALDEREEVVRAEAERQTPPRRVPLSDTIFERHGHVSDLIDGLKLNR